LALPSSASLLLQICSTNYTADLLEWVDAENLPHWLGGRSKVCGGGGRVVGHVSEACGRRCGWQLLLPCLHLCLGLLNAGTAGPQVPRACCWQAVELRLNLQVLQRLKAAPPFAPCQPHPPLPPPPPAQGTLLDDVGPWSDPEVLQRLEPGLPAAGKALKALRISVSSAAPLVAVDDEDGYQSPRSVGGGLGGRWEEMGALPCVVMRAIGRDWRTCGSAEWVRAGAGRRSGKPLWVTTQAQLRAPPGCWRTS
jgi:hypothetical protein